MVNLSQLDGKTVAVILNLPGRTVVWRGMGSYQIDPTMGNVLRISLAELDETDGRPEFVIQETRFEGAIVKDVRHGCDYATEFTMTNEKKATR